MEHSPQQSDVDQAGSATAVAYARPAAVEGHPLGPLVYRFVPDDPRAARAWGGILAGCGLAVLLLAGWLTPSDGGVGTHRQLGLPVCGLLQTTGVPCPTCGMTTAFSHTVRGQWISAFIAQPAGFLICLSMMGAVGISLSVLVTGKTWRLNWFRVTPIRLSVLVVGLLLGGWGFKIFHVLRQDAGGAVW